MSDIFFICSHWGIKNWNPIFTEKHTEVCIPALVFHFPRYCGTVSHKARLPAFTCRPAQQGAKETGPAREFSTAQGLCFNHIRPAVIA